MAEDKKADFLSALAKNQPEIIKIVIEAVSSTISQLARVPVQMEALSISPKREGRSAAVGAVIRYESEKLALELFLEFSADLVLQLYECAFQQSLVNATEGQDLAGEILNVAFGVIDPQLRNRGLVLRSSFPQNLSGPGLKDLLSQLPQDFIQVPMKTLGKTFYLEILASGSLNKKWAYTPKKS